MKFTIINNTPQILEFKLEGVSYNFANALRRIAMNSVMCFAIDTTTFYENSTALFDEYIAHRVGLVPLITPKDYTQKEEILFSLAAEGPGIVYSKELKSDDKNVKVANENIPIIKMIEGQKLKIDGKAILSTGSKSSKFQPGIITYKSDEKGSEFEFYIESFGQMTAMEILHRTLNIMEENIKEVAKKLKK